MVCLSAADQPFGERLLYPKFISGSREMISTDTEHPRIYRHFLWNLRWGKISSVWGGHKSCNNKEKENSEIRRNTGVHKRVWDLHTQDNDLCRKLGHQLLTFSQVAHRRRRISCQDLWLARRSFPVGFLMLASSYWRWFLPHIGYGFFLILAMVSFLYWRRYLVICALLFLTSVI